MDTTTNMQSQSNRFARQCIAEALLRKMDTKELDEINVTDICKEAGFSRMAYYRNFTSKEDILIQYMTMMADDFRAEVLERYPNRSTRSYEIILFAFQYFQNLRVFTLRLIRANLTSIIQDGLNYYFEKYVAGTACDTVRRYAMDYYAGALFNIYTRWIQNGCTESPETMAEIVYNIVKK